MELTDAIKHCHESANSKCGECANEHQQLADSQTANKESRILTCAGGVNNQIIFPLGWETRWEKFYFHVKHFLRNFKANKHDDGVDTLTGIYEKEILTYNPGGYNNIRKGIKRRN